MAAILRGTTAGSGWSTSSQTPANPSSRPAFGRPSSRERVDEQTLDAADVRRRAEPVVDVQDRVADELTGAVIGDVAAALDRHEFGADRGRLTLAGCVRGRPRTRA